MSAASPLSRLVSRCSVRLARLRREWNLQKLRALLRYARRRAAEDRLPQVAASLTFTTVLSVVPVLTVAFALLAAFPMFGDFRAAIERFLFSNLIPGNLTDMITGYVGQFARNAKGLTAVGLIGLMLTAVLTMLTVEDALNAIWRVRQKRRFAQRVLVFWAVLTCGPVLIGGSLSISSYLISVSAGYVGNLSLGINLAVSLAPVLLSAFAFTLLYTTVPNAYVEWRDAAIAGLIAALAFEFSKRGFGHFVTRFPTYTAVYGTFAALPIFLLWIYLSWLVTLLGATIAANLPVIRRGHWRRRTFAGSEFYDALGVLYVLYRAQAQSPRSVGELDLGRRLRVEADYLSDLLARLKAMHLVGRLQRDRGQVHWALICDPARVPLRLLHDRLVLNLARLPRTSLAQQLQGADSLRRVLENPLLDQSLAEIFEQAAPADEPRRRTLEVVPPGWHGQV